MTGITGFAVPTRADVDEIVDGVSAEFNPYCTHPEKHEFCPYSTEQRAFSNSAAKELFFGGAAGPGKTIMILCEGLRQVHIYGYSAVFFRRTYDELDQVIEMSERIFPHMRGTYNKGQHVWKFPWGSTYRLRYLERDSHKYRYQGRAFAYIGFDELTQYPNSGVYDYLFLRNRPLWQGHDVRCYVRAASNPGGPGHSWVKQRFIENRIPGRIYFEKIVDPVTKRVHYTTRQYIPATLDSNDILLNSTDYEISLLGYPDPELRRAMRYGDWNIAAGMMFAELLDGVHKVTARNPLGWTAKAISMDYGYANFTSVGWFETTSGVEGPPHSWQYREFHINETPAPLVAQMVVDRTPETEDDGMIITIDSNAWATPQDGGPSPAEQMIPKFRKRGWKVVPAVKGTGSRVRGSMLLHTYFFTKRRTGPLLKIMDNCPVTWRTLTSLARGQEPQDVEDIAPHQLDDPYDMVRYWAQGRPEPAPPTEAEILEMDPALDKMDDPATYQIAQLEEMKRHGFPKLKVGKGRKPKRHKKPF